MSSVSFSIVSDLTKVALSSSAAYFLFGPQVGLITAVTGLIFSRFSFWEKESFNWLSFKIEDLTGAWKYFLAYCTVNLMLAVFHPGFIAASGLPAMDLSMIFFGLKRALAEEIFLQGFLGRGVEEILAFLGCESKNLKITFLSGLLGLTAFFRFSAWQEKLFFSLYIFLRRLFSGYLSEEKSSLLSSVYFNFFNRSCPMMQMLSYVLEE